MHILKHPSTTNMNVEKRCLEPKCDAKDLNVTVLLLLVRWWVHNIFFEKKENAYRKYREFNYRRNDSTISLNVTKIFQKCHPYVDSCCFFNSTALVIWLKVQASLSRVSLCTTSTWTRSLFCLWYKETLQALLVQKTGAWGQGVRVCQWNPEHS